MTKHFKRLEMSIASIRSLKDVSLGRETRMTAAELITVLQQLPEHARLSVYLSEKGLPRMRETLHLLESPKNATRLRNAIAEYRDAKAIEALRQLPVVSSLAEVTFDPDVQAVIFDAFGTLCRITDLQQPFHRLINHGGGTGFWAARKVLMTRPVDLREGAAVLGLDPKPEVMEALESALTAELTSIELYSEVHDVLTGLRARGIKLAIASNLAKPYAPPVLALLPFELDAYAWSFEVGYLKPDRRIFEWACKRLGVAPENTLMIGDTLSADRDGALGAGMQAIHLQRPDETDGGRG
ncbi:HAD superfamily hydrolase [Caballeronia novacaledonica]|uniref:HAD superfamily hydrolase n=1 Tax=Caballeronia novacaledonica TaxID=1544861 RepID=A0A2U3I1W6_9BURK|nr:HAD-IA family hydrolase [Caballeronia novacaledonica]SPB14114.1 HAD superfamily hydrolase [Caballeronia novacaledonica]